MRIPSPIASRKARIEIIPLIDIVFFLLATFVMVSMSMVKNQGIPVRLPVAQTAEKTATKDAQEYVQVTVSADGTVYFGKEAVSADEVGARLAELKKVGDPRVVLHGDEEAPYGAVVRVLDEARAVGVHKIAVRTRADKTASVETR
ncbi:MAG: hypothetical protein MOGMAGMI_00125 [Candidatus Omnitrophica bacterium]|nr:hypothetical protein [Candidatus Omnitrophota bacterium]